MENNQKRTLLNLAYYTLIVISILFSAVFALRVANTELPALIQIIYYVWTVALVVTLLYDFYCTKRNGMKYIPGLIFLVLTVLCVIMAIVVFFVQGVSIVEITTLEVTYFINILLSFVPIKLAIYAYLFGQKIINFKD